VGGEVAALNQASQANPLFGIISDALRGTSLPDFNLHGVPEPSTGILLVCGLVVLLAWRWRKVRR